MNKAFRLILIVLLLITAYFSVKHILNLYKIEEIAVNKQIDRNFKRAIEKEILTRDTSEIRVFRKPLDTTKTQQSHYQDKDTSTVVTKVPEFESREDIELAVRQTVMIRQNNFADPKDIDSFFVHYLLLDSIITDRTAIVIYYPESGRKDSSLSDSTLQLPSTHSSSKITGVFSEMEITGYVDYPSSFILKKIDYTSSFLIFIGGVLLFLLVLLVATFYFRFSFFPYFFIEKKERKNKKI